MSSAQCIDDMLMLLVMVRLAKYLPVLCKTKTPRLDESPRELLAYYWYKVSIQKVSISYSLSAPDFPALSKEGSFLAGDVARQILG